MPKPFADVSARTQVRRLREVRTICHCGKRATMVVRQGPDGKPARRGAQVQIGGNETYLPLCRRHWRAAMGDDGS